MSPRTLALFDLDYTLLEGDTEELWARFLHRQGLVDGNFVLTIEAFYRQYDQGALDFPVYEEFLLGPLAGLPMHFLSALRDDFLKELRQMLRPGMLDRLERHRRDNCKALLVTAANSFLAEPVARLLGFSDLICTQIETSNGKLTGRIGRMPAFRQGKVVLLAEWLRENKISLKDSWGYSDSHNDLPLLELVDHPVMVTPDPFLRAYGLERGWELLEPAFDGPPGQRTR